MNNIYFKSTEHQRYTNGCEVGGLQTCNRAVEIKPNVSGCEGYNIPIGKGYIVTIYNLDGVHPMWGNNVQMSPKPMVVVVQTDTKLELRGYPVLAMTPFGWMEVDQSDYGITIYFDAGKVKKCVLHMFDRNTDIVYL
jgi:hypothetical protein